MLDLHKRYGPIVRIAPNELAFGDPKAWDDIMGHRVGAKKGVEFEKSMAFYQPVGGPSDVVTSSGEEHAALRRTMSHGFSARSLKDQNREKPVDMKSWYNWTTFDLIGDLAFSETFGCLENSRYDPWIKTIFQVAKVGNVMQSAAHFPPLRSLIIRILSSKAIRERNQQHEILTKEKLLRRMQLEKAGGRPDLIHNLLKKKDDIGMTFDELVKNAGALVIDGSETTATMLSGATYLLLKNPEALKKLTQEVRSTFRSEAEIDISLVNRLDYLSACLQEALRMYLPFSAGLPRVSPKGGAVVCDRFIPEDTIVSAYHWAMYHNKKYWTDPMEYRPERFVDDPAYIKDRKDVLQPFHIGPRNCLGKNLAYVEMRFILARIIWNFDLGLAPESEEWLERQKIFIF